ncbi:hypothetical protein BaRGS_00028885 [Batillaria attramentaria]|uniref:Uncharacterized protein n=1 Tax=Batillaria attramentaria TaxID=370345 RepID=A0ABD0JYW0_9CAEN
MNVTSWPVRGKKGGIVEGRKQREELAVCGPELREGEEWSKRSAPLRSPSGPPHALSAFEGMSIEASVNYPSHMTASAHLRRRLLCTWTVMLRFL